MMNSSIGKRPPATVATAIIARVEEHQSMEAESAHLWFFL